MHRLTRRGPQLASFPGVAGATVAPSALRAARLAATAHLRNYATSAPKEAEGPSAASGGSRSKDAVEGAKGRTVHDMGSAKGRTGGGEPLEASQNAPPQPKVHNSSVPGTNTDKLTKEQQEEVDRHNAEFEKGHDRAAPSPSEDKVDKKFWAGRGGKEKN